MVYRLIPSYQMKPSNPVFHFGVEDLTKPGLLKGLGVGLLIAVVLLVTVLLIALKTTKLSRYVDVQDGQKKLNLKRFVLELVLPIGLGMMIGGAIVGHNCLN